MRTLLLLAILVLAAFAGPVAAQQERFVRRSGNDANDGLTPETAVRTIERAFEMSGPGDVIYVGGGRHDGAVSLNGPGGTEASPIRIVGDRDASRTGDEGYPEIGLNGSQHIRVRADHVHLETLWIDGRGGTVDAVRIEAAEGVRLHRVMISGAAEDAVSVIGLGSVRVEECFIGEPVDDGVQVDEGYAYVVDSTLRNVGDDGLLVNGPAATIEAQRVTIDGSRMGAVVRDGALSIVSSVIAGHAGDGVLAERGSALTVVGCTIYGGANGVGIDSRTASRPFAGVVNTILTESAGWGIDQRDPAFLFPDGYLLLWNNALGGSNGPLPTPSTEADPLIEHAGRQWWGHEPSSPARDAGDPVPGAGELDPSVDLVGVDRDADGLWDIGAIESGAVPGPPAGQGLVAEWTYGFTTLLDADQIDFSTPAFVTREPSISFWDTREYPFWAGIPREFFAVRLTGQIEVPRDGTWRFRVRSDDGSVLWINGTRVVDHDGRHSFTAADGAIDLTAGRHDLEVRFFEWTGRQGLVLDWMGPGDSDFEPVPGDAFDGVDDGDGDPFFTDVTAAVDADVTTTSDLDEAASVHVADMDNDGWEDVLIGGDDSVILWNDGDGTFTPGFMPQTFYEQTALIDIENDGLIDTWSASFRNPNSEGVLSNRSGRVFSRHWGMGSRLVNNSGIAAMEINGDGLLDLVALSGNNNAIMLNQGEEQNDPSDFGWDNDPANGVSGWEGSGHQFAATADADGDGRLDLFFHAHGGRLFVQDGAGVFRLEDWGTDIRTATSDIAGSAWGDYDNDGDMDLFCANPRDGERGELYRNEGGIFVEVGLAAGLDNTGEQRSAVWGDYDHDGLLDLYITTTGSENVMYRQTAIGVFEEQPGVARAAGLDAHDANYVDFDQDGDLDLVISGENGPARVLRNDLDAVGNPGDERRSLQVRVVGIGEGGTNRLGVGTTVEVRTLDGLVVLGRREIGTARGLGGTTAPWVHFGGLEPGAAYTVRFVLPGGRVVERDVVPSTVFSVIGGHVVPQLYTLDESTLPAALEVVRWRETSPVDP